MHLKGMGAMLITTVSVMGGVLTIASSTNFVSASLPAMPLQVVQNAPTFTERAEQIDTCRGTTSALTIYKSSALSGAIGTVAANTSVTLTGIFGAGVVQIKAPQVGWVTTNTLITDCGAASDGGLPGDIDTKPQYCRRLRSAEVDGSTYADLNTGLVAREKAGGDFQYVGNSSQTDGPTKAAIVRFSGRATDLQDADGRRWIRIKYIGMQGTPRVGWVPNGAAGVNRNLAACIIGQN